jgi:hypothetical protein
VAGGAAGGVGGAERALMAGDKRLLNRRDIAVIIVIAISVIASFVALIRWEMGRECVRWATRFDTTEGGVVYRTQVCAEFRSRQHGDEPPLDSRGPKTK